jgi:hypothetical protein
MSSPSPVQRPAGAAIGRAPEAEGADGAPTELERRVLAFERDWDGTTGAKEAAIRSQLGLTTTRYYQLLHAVIDNPIALVEDPLLVRRLQRLRATRAETRAARTFRRG